MNISQYIISLYDENMQVTTIKTDNDFNFYENNFDVRLANGSIVNIKIQKYTCPDSSIVEFYNSNNELIARAKGFDSVL